MAYLEVETPLGVRVRTTPAYWARIVTYKHPVLRGREDLVVKALETPTQVRRSKSDPSVHLYYAEAGEHHVCVVAKHEDGEGFIVTAYVTDRIKEGDPIWPP